MQVGSLRWQGGSGWQDRTGTAPADAQWVLYFGAPAALADPAPIEALRRRFPDARLMGATTGGEIEGPDVLDEAIVASVVRFDHTRLKAAQVPLGDSREAGRQLGALLAAPDLVHVFILSDGIHANGSAILRGLFESLPAQVMVTGGLAGDGPDFRRTLVGLDGALAEDQVAAIGFYGDRLRIGHGCVGGWDLFGPQRVITRAEGRVLYELDGQPALALYRRYLGDHAAGLPGSGLLFPLSIQPTQTSGDSLVRTIVGIDEARQALIFAGDVPEGWVARLMRGHYDRLIDGAAEAAEAAARVAGDGDRLAIIVSCIGRKLLMGQRIADESEAAAGAFGPGTATVGFYSYGEIGHHAATGQPRLHNQTMTVTTLAEA